MIRGGRLDPYAPPGSAGTWIDPRLADRLPRLLVALWCTAAAVAHLVVVLLAFADDPFVQWREAWAIPFAFGMSGAALTAVRAAFLDDPRLADRLFWASLGLAAVALATRDLIGG